MKHNKHTLASLSCSHHFVALFRMPEDEVTHNLVILREISNNNCMIHLENKTKKKETKREKEETKENISTKLYQPNYINQTISTKQTFNTSSERSANFFFISACASFVLQITMIPHVSEI
jgi:hypothetical protein